MKNFLLRNENKKLSQIVFDVDPVKKVRSKFDSLSLTRKYSVLSNNQLATGLFRLDSDLGPYLLVRADNLIEEISNKPFKIGFSFFRLNYGGLFVIYVESQIMKEKLQNGFLEMGYGLDESDVTKRIKDVLKNDTLHIVLAEQGGFFGLQALYDIIIKIEKQTQEILDNEFNSLLNYHINCSNRDFQSNMNEMWRLMPADESPILSNYL